MITMHDGIPSSELDMLTVARELEQLRTDTPVDTYPTMNVRIKDGGTVYRLVVLRKADADRFSRSQMALFEVEEHA